MNRRTLHLCLASLLVIASTAHAAEKARLTLDAPIRLGPATGVDEVVLDALDPLGESAAIAWSAGDDLLGGYVDLDNGHFHALLLDDGQLLAVDFTDDGIRVGSRRPASGVDAIVADLFTVNGAPAAEVVHGEVASGDGSEVALDFFADGGTATAIASVGVVVTLTGPDGHALATTSLGASDSTARTPRVSVHDEEVLVGFDRYTACGQGEELHAAVVNRLDEDALLVRNPRRFPSGGCGDDEKRLVFLGGPSDVGSLAVFHDATARRFITGTPPPSEQDFVIPVRRGETIAAVAMDEGHGRILVVTRTVAANRNTKLFIQGFGREGRARTPRVALDNGTGSAPGQIPRVAVDLTDDGTGWVAYTQTGAGADSGLYLRHVEARFP